MTPRFKASKRGFYFLGIGGIAALVHVGLVLCFVTFFNLHPLLANGFAFLIAFQISFFGHKNLTFALLLDKKILRLPHFFMVATSAGLINEGLYFLLLHYTRINYLLGLILVLGLVSGYSFILSRFWACR
jgi:putative flippase GtrA